MELLRVREPLAPPDSKSFRRHSFVVPARAHALEVAFSFDRGGELPHSLVTLSLFDPAGFRGAGHRFAPRQRIRLAPDEATPGFVPGPIPAGEWTVEVDVHCVVADGEYEVVVATTEVGSVEAGGLYAGSGLRGTNALGVPTNGPRRWFRGELHLHSTHSDGRWTVEEMAAAARERPVDFMFLTDHNTVTGIDALRRAVSGRMAIHPGQELTTFRGHALALGPPHWLDWRAGLDGRTMDDVARDVRASGGLMVVAHPDAPPDPICTGCRWTHEPFDPGLADAVEVWGGLWNGPEERNQGCLDLWRRWLNAGHRLAATGATDAHRHEDWQGAVPLTFVLADAPSLDSLLEAVLAGRTYVSSGPVLQLEVHAEDGRIAGLGESVHRARTIAAWCSTREPGELRIVVGGETRVHRRVEGEGRVEAAPRAGDRWCCAELWGGDVLLAVTSPIYLAWDGLSKALD